MGGLMRERGKWRGGTGGEMPEGCIKMGQRVARPSQSWRTLGAPRDAANAGRTDIRRKGRIRGKRKSGTVTGRGEGERVTRKEETGDGLLQRTERKRRERVEPRERKPEGRPEREGPLTPEIDAAGRARAQAGGGERFPCQLGQSLASIQSEDGEARGHQRRATAENGCVHVLTKAGPSFPWPQAEQMARCWQHECSPLRGPTVLTLSAPVPGRLSADQ